MASDTSFDIRLVRYEEVHNIRPEDFDDLVKAANIVSGARILDCGCGYGACTREVLARLRNDQFISCDLIDHSSVQLELSKRELEAWESLPNVRIRRIQGHFPDPRCSDSGYNVVFAKMVLHEVPKTDQHDFLKAIFNCLKPDGLLLLWDTCPSASTQQFFQDVVISKDRLAGFKTLVRDRYFFSAAELSELMHRCGFVRPSVVSLIDHVLDSERRLKSEFQGDNELYDQWVETIRDMAKELSAEVREKELLFDDDGKRIEFHTRSVIISAQRPGLNACVFCGQGGIVPCDDPDKERDLFPSVVSGALAGAREMTFLGRRKALLRPAILTRSYGDGIQLCKDGLDYLYNYPDTPLKDKQVRAYVAYLTGIYSMSRSTGNTKGAQGMSGAVTNVLAKHSGVAWLVVRALEPSLVDSPLELVLSGFDLPLGVAHVRLRGNVRDFFEPIMNQVVDNTWLAKQLRTSRIERLLTIDRHSLDSFAESLSAQFMSIWEPTFERAIRQRGEITCVIPNDYLKTFLFDETAIRVNTLTLLLTLQQYLVLSGTPVCYYVSPPSLVTRWGRLDRGCLVLATDSLLEPEGLEAIQSFVVRLWSGAGEVDAQLSERFEQMQHRSRALAHAAYAVGHPLRNRLGDLHQSVKDIQIGIYENWEKQEVDPDQVTRRAVMQVKSCYRTAELMHFMANVVGLDSYEGLDQRFCKTEPYAVGNRLPEIIREVNRIEKQTTLVPEEDSLKQIKNVRIRGFTTNNARFYDDFYDELLYEIVRNAAKYGTVQQCLLKIETDQNLIRDSELKLRNSDVAVIITNECKTEPDLGRLKIQPQMIQQWLPFGDRLEGGLRFLWDCLKLSRSGGLYIRVARVNGKWYFSVRLEMCGLTSDKGRNRKG